MRPGKRPRPPGIVSALLQFLVLHRPGGQTLLGDLEELWQERREAQGLLRANLWYSGQVVGAAIRLFPGRFRGQWRPNSLGLQLRHSLRRLLRNPSLTVVCILTISVGIGSTTAIYSVVDGVLIQPLPFQHPERLVGIWFTAPGLGFDRVDQAPSLHYTFEAESQTLEGLGMWHGAQASVTGLAQPEEVSVVRMTWRTLPLLGIQPILGRSFLAEEDTPAGPPTVLLAHGYWQDRLGGDPSILGRTLRVDGTEREVIGILPRDLHFLGSDPDLYLPLAYDRGSMAQGSFSYRGLGRLGAGITLEQAKADLDRLIPLAFERYPGPFTVDMIEEARLAVEVHPLKDDVVGLGGASTIQQGTLFDLGRMLWVVMGTVWIVLLIACANVANLLLVRAEWRQQEYSVRAAIGASTARIAADSLLESLILAGAGGLIGLALAFGGLKLLVAFGPSNLPRLQQIGVDGNVLFLSLAISVLSGLLIGILPALRIAKVGLIPGLRRGERGGGAERGQNLTRQSLVVAQVALALVLLTGSGLMVRSFMGLRSLNPGFSEPERIVTFRVGIPEGEEADEARVAMVFQEILLRVRQIPGVESAALTSSVTMGRRGGRNVPVEVEGFPQDPDQIPPVRRAKFIGGAYHATMGNRPLAGRSITERDVDDRAPVAVITEDLAREYWATPREAIGSRIRPFGSGEEGWPWREIVGVVGNILDNGLEQPPVPTVFFPQVVEDLFLPGPRSPRSMAFVVRTRADNPQTLLPGLQEAVWSVNSALPLAHLRTLEQLASGSIASFSFTLVSLALAAGIALLLGLVGIYGVVSYLVSLRTREIGLRIAVGADPGNVRKMVLKSGAILAGTGMLAGLVASAGLTRLLGSLLFGVRPLDLWTFASVAVGLSLVVLIASWIPASRASRVNPIVALRSD